MMANKRTVNRTARRLKKNRHGLSLDAPLLHQDHSRPVTRRDFLRQSFITGTGVTLGGSLFSLFANPRAAHAELSADLQTMFANNPNCALGTAVATSLLSVLIWRVVPVWLVPTCWRWTRWLS